MKRQYTLALGLAIAVSLSACAQGENGAGNRTAEVISNAPPLASVNGQAITQEQFQFHLERRTHGQPFRASAADRQMLLEELVDLALLSSAAEAKGLSRDPVIAGRLENLRSAVLAQAYVEQVEQESISEEEVRAEYDRRFGGEQHLEYSARHILVESEEEARKLIEQLQSGADFAELAQEHSEDPGSAPRGGDLGWFQASDMVGPFAQAVMELEPGQLTGEPVETRFGWHVIRLEETREATPPEFEQVAGELRQMLAQERLENELERLRGEATVEIHRQPD